MEYQKETHDVTLLMVTSAKNSSWNSDYLLSSLEGTGLLPPSIVRQKLFTIDTRLIMKSIGALKSKDKKKILERSKIHLSAMGIS